MHGVDIFVTLWFAAIITVGAVLHQAPENAVARVGSTVQLVCETSSPLPVAWWFMSRDRGLWAFKGFINSAHKHKYNISSPTPGRYDLLIYDVSFEDAGEYICSEDENNGGPGAGAHLVVIAPPVVCYFKLDRCGRLAAVTQPGVIPPSPGVIDLICGISYGGNVAPKLLFNTTNSDHMTWTSVDTSVKGFASYRLTLSPNISWSHTAFDVWVMHSFPWAQTMPHVSANGTGLPIDLVLLDPVLPQSEVPVYNLSVDFGDNGKACLALEDACHVKLPERGCPLNASYHFLGSITDSLSVRLDLFKWNVFSSKEFSIKLGCSFTFCSGQLCDNPATAMMTANCTKPGQNFRNGDAVIGNEMLVAIAVVSLLLTASLVVYLCIRKRREILRFVRVLLLRRRYPVVIGGEGLLQQAAGIPTTVAKPRLDFLKSLKGIKSDVYGIELLNNLIYVLHLSSNIVERFCALTAEKVLDIVLLDTSGKKKHPIHQCSMAACPLNNCLYFADMDNKCIWKWSEKTGLTLFVEKTCYLKGLFVNSHGEVLVMGNHPPAIYIYGDTAHDARPPRLMSCLAYLANIFHFAPQNESSKLLRKICLPHNMTNLNHVIETKAGTYIVAHGNDDSLHRICEVDSRGRILRSHGKARGIGKNRMKRPIHLALDEICLWVFVADYYNNRIVVLDMSDPSKFTRLLEIPLKSDYHSTDSPWRLQYCPSRHDCDSTTSVYLLVGFDDGRVDIFNVSSEAQHRD